MMLVSAGWLLPISRRPVRDGAVLVSEGRIEAVGTADDLVGRFPEAEHVRFDDCVLMPGLVNAHTHLSLTALHGLVPSMAFEEWLPRIVAAMSVLEPDDFAASAVVGTEESLLSGVTTVGDIVYRAGEADAAAAAGLGGVYYWEVLGIDADDLPATLERLAYPVRTGGACGVRVRCGLSPHSPYTSGPSLLRTVRDIACELGAPYAIHVAESEAETRLLRDGSGPLADTAGRSALGFETPHAAPVTYLDRLGALDGATAIHACQVNPAEIPRLAATVRGVVTCPRSNRYLHNTPPKVARFLDAGIPVGIGTDSSASNDDLDLMTEVRAVRSAEPEIGAARLLEMATAMGAIAIGVEDRFGVLEPGMQADLALFRVGPSDDPEGAVVSAAGRDSLAASMSGGAWRVRDGALVSRDRAATEVARRATARAQQRLAGV